MKNIIITLDIDDCILPNNKTFIGNYDDNLTLLEINLKRIYNIIQKYKAKVFITSSWHYLLKLRKDKLKIKEKYSFTLEELNAFSLLSTYLNGHVIGLSAGDRYAEVQDFLNEGNIVVNIDDFDFSNVTHTNHLWVEANGLITNKDLFLIDNFLKHKNVE